MKGNKVFWFLVILLILAFGMMLIPKKAGASDGMPPNVIAWEYAGELFVTDYDEDGHPRTQHICPCEDDCNIENVIVQENVTEKDKPKPTPTAPPPPPIKTEKPEKVKCNSGRGNGSEGSPDCDPGNSGKNKGGD